MPGVPRSRAAVAAVAVAVSCVAAGVRGGEVRLERRADRIDVSIDGRPFTSYVFRGHRKPILFPVHGPGGESLTRSWPIVADVTGEAHDHPHHESLWFTHGRVNGIDFWTSSPQAANADRRADNRIEHVAIDTAEGGADGLIEARSRWVRADDTVVCSDITRIVCAGDATSRTIDYTITIRADHGAVTLGDTKEGTMALRVATPLQLWDLDGSRGAAGTCLNSEGLRDADVWGKPARWVGVSGPMGGRSVGVAMLDHPRNLRHPTHWHARDYGLLAANPFGLHDFTGAAAGTGDYTIPAGGSLTLRYLFVFHEGDTAAAGIDSRWERWIAAGCEADR